MIFGHFIIFAYFYLVFPLARAVCHQWALKYNRKIIVLRPYSCYGSIATLAVDQIFTPGWLFDKIFAPGWLFDAIQFTVIYHRLRNELWIWNAFPNVKPEFIYFIKLAEHHKSCRKKRIMWGKKRVAVWEFSLHNLAFSEGVPKLPFPFSAFWKSLGKLLHLVHVLLCQ